MMTTKPPHPGVVAPRSSADPKPFTDPMAEGDRLDLLPIGAVTALRVVGRNVELPLPIKKFITVGSDPEVDLRVTSMRDDGRQQVSKLHVVIQRKGTGLWIVDQTSTNGTFVDDRREVEFARAAGQSFRVGDVTLLAADEQLRALLPKLQWALGLSAHEHVDEVLALAAHDDPLLLLGPSGCGQRVLAEAIHQASARAPRAFVPIEPPLATEGEWRAVLAHSTSGTAFLDLSFIANPSARFLRELFGATYKTRAIVAAPDLSIASDLLGHEHLTRLRPIVLPPVSARVAEILRLFDLLFLETGSKHRIANLGSDNVVALCRRDWEKNLDELTSAAPRLLAVLAHDMSITEAAASLPNTTRQALSKWLVRLGLRINAA